MLKGGYRFTRHDRDHKHTRRQYGRPPACQAYLYIRITGDSAGILFHPGQTNQVLQVASRKRFCGPQGGGLLDLHLCRVFPRSIPLAHVTWMSGSYQQVGRLTVRRVCTSGG